MSCLYCGGAHTLITDLCKDAMQDLATQIGREQVACVVCGETAIADEMGLCLICGQHSHDDKPECKGQCNCVLVNYLMSVVVSV